MLAGATAKTNNHKFAYYWHTEGDRRDFAMFGKVGSWVGQNAKVLDKKTAVEAVKLLADQFPELVSIDCTGFDGRLARWT